MDVIHLFERPGLTTCAAAHAMLASTGRPVHRRDVSTEPLTWDEAKRLIEGEALTARISPA